MNKEEFIEGVKRTIIMLIVGFLFMAFANILLILFYILPDN